MNLVYTSPEYQVVEYAGEHGGFEVINRHLGIATYLRGEAADKLRQSLTDAFLHKASEDVIDEFLGSYDVLMQQRALHH